MIPDTQYADEEVKAFCLQWRAHYERELALMQILKDHNKETIWNEFQNRALAEMRGDPD